MNISTHEKKINKREVIEISIVWTILSLISSLPYIEKGFLIALIAFMLPLFIYIGIVLKFGSGYILRKLEQNKISKGIFNFIEKILKIENFEKNIIDGSAIRKTRLMVLFVVAFIVAIAIIAPFPLDLKLGVLTLYVPLFYVLHKGYRLAIITLLAIKTIDTVGFLMSKGNIVFGIIWLVLLYSIYTYALYVENTRVKMEKEGKIPTPKYYTIRDTWITVASYILCFGIMVFIMMP